MLVLSRLKDQQITIGEVEITVLKIGEQRVKIGIKAPDGVRIMRTEIATKE